MMNTSELELMIAYDGKAYECIRCTNIGNKRKILKNKASFIRHCGTKMHKSEDFTFYPKMDDLFTRLLYYKTEELKDYIDADGLMFKLIIDYAIGKLDNKEYAERYIEERGLTKEQLNKCQKLKGLFNMHMDDGYTAKMVQKIIDYRTRASKIIRESDVMCTDVMGIVAEYI